MKKFYLAVIMLCITIAPFGHLSAKNDTIPQRITGDVEVQISDLKQYGESELVVELEPKEGKSDYILPVVIGPCEITGIYEQTNKIKSPRPLTYDLMKNILDAANIKLEKITITKLEDGVYYALLSLDDNGKKLEIDSRPSDAINLALRYSSTIYVSKAVFESAKEPKKKPEDPVETVH